MATANFRGLPGSDFGDFLLNTQFDPILPLLSPKTLSAHQTPASFPTTHTFLTVRFPKPATFGLGRLCVFAVWISCR